MKMLVTAVALTTAIASPALAQSMDQQTKQNAPVTQRMIASPSAQSFAQNVRVRPHSPNPAFDVYDAQGQYVGSDPDLRIRSELSRDTPNNLD